MRTSTFRVTLAMAAFLALQWPKPASADVTVMGTVGEVGIMSNGILFFGSSASAIRFKFTDLTQTKACTNVPNGVSGIGPGYAWFFTSDPTSREWYAALLVSKKGAPINCTIVDNANCHVTSCTLP